MSVLSERSQLCPLTLCLEQRFQLEYFSTASRKLVLQKGLGATFDIKLCLRTFASWSCTPMGQTKGPVLLTVS
jgi:hypothetical protein